MARRSEQSCCATVAGLCAVSIPSICREERLKGFRGLEGLKVFSAQSPVVCPLPSVKPRIVDISGAVLSNLALDTSEVTDRCIISANNWTAVGVGRTPTPPRQCMSRSWKCFVNFCEHYVRKLPSFILRIKNTVCIPFAPMSSVFVGCAHHRDF